MTPTRLLIIDDHDDVRRALNARLSTVDSLEIVGCTGCWRTGLRDAVRMKPDVVLLEIKRADMRGLHALRCLIDECPYTNVIVLTSYPNAKEQAKAFRIGAVRYLLKEIDTPQLAREIHAVRQSSTMI